MACFHKLYLCCDNVKCDWNELACPSEQLQVISKVKKVKTYFLAEWKKKWIVSKNTLILFCNNRYRWTCDGNILLKQRNKLTGKNSEHMKNVNVKENLCWFWKYVCYIFFSCWIVFKIRFVRTVENMEKLQRIHSVLSFKHSLM